MTEDANQNHVYYSECKGWPQMTPETPTTGYSTGINVTRVCYWPGYLLLTCFLLLGAFLSVGVILVAVDFTDKYESEVRAMGFKEGYQLGTRHAVSSFSDSECEGRLLEIADGNYQQGFQHGLSEGYWTAQEITLETCEVQCDYEYRQGYLAGLNSSRPKVGACSPNRYMCTANGPTCESMSKKNQ